MQDFNNPAPGGFGATPPPPKKKSKVWIVLVVVLLVVGLGFVSLVALGLGGYFLLSRRAQEAASAGSSPGTRAGLSGTASSSSDDEAEEPEPTDAQAAAVAGGQSAEWEQQEISWTVPQRWSKHSASSNSFLWRSPGSMDAASLIGSVSPMSADFPAEVSLNAFYQGAQQRKANGEVNEVRWVKIGGVKGVLFRESAPEEADSPQRLQWIAYRNYKGQQQMLNIMLASRGKDFARHEDALYGILYSMKLQ
jgi:hypothetical protein